MKWVKNGITYPQRLFILTLYIVRFPILFFDENLNNTDDGINSEKLLLLIILILIFFLLPSVSFILVSFM